MLKVGVVGVGHLGQHHARIFSQIASCELVGIYDQNPARAQEIAVRLGVKSFPTYEEMLDAVEAVDVAATTTYHYALAKPALERGKHVFLEKPITAELHQAEELLNLAAKKNLKIQVGHIERFNPVILKVEDEINDPMFIESHRLASFNPRGSDVPVVLDLMIHDIDLILCFTKSEVVDIKASGVGILTPSIDIANARLEFANGAVANVTSSRVSLKVERKIRFFQKDAYLSLDFQEKEVTVIKKGAKMDQMLPEFLKGAGQLSLIDLADMKHYSAADAPKDALTMELESFVEAVSQDRRPTVNGEDGFRALQVAYEIMHKISPSQYKF